MAGVLKYFQRPHCRGVAIFEAVLLENAGQVDFHGVFRAAETGGDVGVGLALGPPQEDFRLARGKAKGFEWFGGIEVGFEFDLGHRGLLFLLMAVEAGADGRGAARSPLASQSRLNRAKVRRWLSFVSPAS
jgi:hypothetical protein